MVGELIVPGKISGLGVRMLLDPGASVSLISTYLWENLYAADPRWTLMLSEAKVRTVSGDLANVRGEIVLGVAIGQQYYVHQFLVMDMQEDVILGWTLFPAISGRLELGARVLTLRGRNAVAFKKYKLDDAKARRIVTKSRTLIPASSMAVVNIKIQSQCVGALPDWRIVVPTKTPVRAMGAVAAAILVDSLADSIPVMVMNSTDSTIVLSPGQTLRFMVPIEYVSQPVTKLEGNMIEKTEVLFPKQGPEPHGPVCRQIRKVARLGNTEVTAREGLTPSRMEYNGETIDVNDTGDIASSDHLAHEAQSIPHHLQKLYIDSCKAQGLTQTNRNQLAGFLHQNADVFVRASDNLGHVTTVKHRIDTGDVFPIKQAPRTIPLHRKQTVQEEIEKMLQRGVIEPCNP